MCCPEAAQQYKVIYKVTEKYEKDKKKKQEQSTEYSKYSKSKVQQERERIIYIHKAS